MKLGDIFFGMGVLILVFLLVFYFKGANEILRTTFAGSSRIIRNLQGFPS